MARCLLLCWLFVCGDSFACLRVWFASNGGDVTSILSTNTEILNGAYINKERRYPQMNIRPIPREKWIVVDKDYDLQILLKRKYFAERPEELLQTRGAHRRESEAAAHELLLMLAAHLPRVYPERFSREGTKLVVKVAGETERWEVESPNAPALSIVGQLLQEDLLLIRPDSNGNYKLETGFVGFPSNWLLKNMMGLSVDGIHGAVDGYAETLGHKVNAMIAHLRPELTFARNNWFIYDMPTLAVRPDVEYTFNGPAITTANAGTELYLRTEFETFVKLPESGYVVFTIKPHVFEMKTLVEHPEVGYRLLDMLTAPEFSEPFDYQSVLVRYFRRNLPPQ